MATAEEVISRALSLILVRQSESPLRPDEFQDGLEMLNDMMLSWDGEGLPLGYTELTTISDVLTVPSTALLAIKQNLAVQLAPEFGANVGQILAINAARSKTALYRATIRARSTCYPSTLPIGSGNSGGDTVNNRKFYHGCDEDGLLTEQEGNIQLETNTNQDT